MRQNRYAQARVHFSYYTGRKDQVAQPGARPPQRAAILPLMKGKLNVGGVHLEYTPLPNPPKNKVSSLLTAFTDILNYYQLLPG